MPLTGLIRLEALQLGGNQISDITPLTGLTHLTNLSLNSNEIQDITPLMELTKLERLALQYNDISDSQLLTKLKQQANLLLDQRLNSLTSNANILNQPHPSHPSIKPVFSPVNKRSTQELEKGKQSQTISDNLSNPSIKPVSPPDKKKSVQETVQAVPSRLIPDANLAAAIREELLLYPSSPISPEHLSRLESFSIYRAEIKNITGLENATNLNTSAALF